MLRPIDAWLRKVFELDRGGGTDRRPAAPAASLRKVFTALVLGATAQARSPVEIEAACPKGWLVRRVGPISNNTFVCATGHQDPPELFALAVTVAHCLKRLGLVRSSWVRGSLVATVDGLEICHC